MPTHKSRDYKLSAIKYYLSHSKNEKIFFFCEYDTPKAKNPSPKSN